MTRDLLEAGWRVRALVRPGRPAPDEARVEVARGDITERASLDGLAEGIDVVFHLAGHGHVVAVGGNDLERFRKVNVLGTRNVLAPCVGKPIRRFVHVSSTAALGLAKSGMIDEDTLPRPRTPYQLSKWQAEGEACAAVAHSGVSATIP